MAVSGQRYTTNVLSAQRKIDLSKQILLLEPDKAAFTQFSKFTKDGANRQAATDPLFKWLNDELWNRFDAVNNGAGYASGATSMVVDNGSLFTVDDVIKIPRTGEVLLVTAVSTNTLTVTRSIGATAAAALVDDDPILIYATAAEEGALPRTARSENPVLATNYTEIFKRTTEASGTWLSASNESSPHDWTHQVKKDYLEHFKDIEYAGLFGLADEVTGANSKPQRTTGGLLEYMTQNNVAAGGAWTLAEIATFIRNITRYGSKKKVLFAGRLVSSVLSEHSMNKLQTSVGDQTFGVRIMHWLDPNGELQIVSHPLMEGAVYGGYGIAVDFAAQAIKYRYLDGDGPGGSRDTHAETNVEEPGRDGRRDQLISECGFQVGLPETGGVVTGVASAS